MAKTVLSQYILSLCICNSKQSANNRTYFRILKNNYASFKFHFVNICLSVCLFFYYLSNCISFMILSVLSKFLKATGYFSYTKFQKKPINVICTVIQRRMKMQDSSTLNLLKSKLFLQFPAEQSSNSRTNSHSK